MEGETPCERPPAQCAPCPSVQLRAGFSPVLKLQAPGHRAFAHTVPPGLVSHPCKKLVPVWLGPLPSHHPWASASSQSLLLQGVWSSPAWMSLSQCSVWGLAHRRRSRNAD